MKFDFVNTSKKTACHSLRMRGSRAVFFSLFISSFLILTACTDYVSKIDEQIEEMKAGLLIDSRDG